jgi:hypothetical protein
MSRPEHLERPLRDFSLPDQLAPVVRQTLPVGILVVIPLRRAIAITIRIGIYGSA